ncbi:hypothetical protein GCM10017752_29290 [Streptomyces roseoviridis]
MVTPDIRATSAIDQAVIGGVLPSPGPVGPTPYEDRRSFRSVNRKPVAALRHHTRRCSATSAPPTLRHPLPAPTRPLPHPTVPGTACRVLGGWSFLR